MEVKTHIDLYENVGDSYRKRLYCLILQTHLQNGQHLESAIGFLSQTSAVIKIFRDKRPITDPNDQRLEELESVRIWFDNWAKEAKDAKSLPSAQCMEDMQAMLFSFQDVCKTHLADFPEGRGVVPARFNSDLVDNHFCQTRGIYGGNLTNPSYAQYCNTVNSVILGQSMRSRGRKGNAAIVATKPFPLYKR